MRTYFVDTWYFIARLDPTDAHHQRARSLVAKTGGRLITHDAVLTEVLGYFSGFGRQQRSAAAVGVRNAMAAMEVVPSTRDLFLRALHLYESRPDKEYSLVDCMSMELMKQRGISLVLTNDHHFRQEGFTVVSQ